MEESAYHTQAATEARHFWFAARRRVLDKVVQSLALPADARLLDFGSGTGGNLPLLSRFGRVEGVEPSATARAFATQQAAHSGARFFSRLDDTAGNFDAGFLLDVLEHLDHPVAELRSIRARLRPGAPLVVTVPAHPWLFGAHDRYLHHRCRYTEAQLTGELAEAGFQLRFVSPMNFLLLPVAIAARLGEVARERILGTPTTPAGVEVPPAPLNRLFYWAFAGEQYWLPRRRLPTGLSLLALATS